MTPKRTPHLILGKIDIAALLAAQKSFDDALPNLHHSLLERDGAIQRFEYTFELAWKTMKRILQFKGSTSQLPRDVIRDAAANGLIDNPVVWFEFLEKRNKTSHIYEESVANEVASVLPIFHTELESFTQRIKKL